MTGSALGWALLNLRIAGRRGLRRQILGRALASKDPAQALRTATEALALLDVAAPDGGRRDEDAREEMERTRLFGAGLLTLEDEDFPRLLRASSDPPPLVYVWGRLVPEDLLAIAVVGSRRATPYGIAIARRIGFELAAAGFTVVSGLARGIDAAAHRGALEAGGRTLALLGSGLDRIYPVEHLKLAQEIAGRGAVLTEFPFGTPPLRVHFPERNRVIAWITWATVVVEAAKGSGSLITARLAADEGRMVHAVPGALDAPNAEGTNALLREGALVCRSAADVIDDLAPQLSDAAALLASGRGAAAHGALGGGTASPLVGASSGAGPARDARAAWVARAAGLTPEERGVLEKIPATRGIGIERLGEACGLAPGRLLAVLLELEMKGAVKQLPGRRFLANV